MREWGFGGLHRRPPNPKNPRIAYLQNILKIGTLEELFMHGMRDKWLENTGVPPYNGTQ
jgi:hypothetical protein